MTLQLENIQKKISKKNRLTEIVQKNFIFNNFFLKTQKNIYPLGILEAHLERHAKALFRE